ncbi:MAG: ribonuclease HIII [Candidatus ainarchaeum sp.]|nr:ribonuclease HIII [Candidatus ainarchaeum sp.]
MNVLFKVDENYIKSKIKQPFTIVKSNPINNGFQILVHKNKEICGYIRIYSKKDNTSNIDFSQIKNNRLEIESNFKENNIKIEKGTRMISISVSFNSKLDNLILKKIEDFLKVKEFKEQLFNGQKNYKFLTTTITIYNNGTINIQGKESKDLKDVMDFIINKRTEKNYNTLKLIFEENHNEIDINYDEFKEKMFKYHERLVEKYKLRALIEFLYSNDTVELLDMLSIYQIVSDKKDSILNYAQIVRPLGIVYEGFLLKLLYNVGELSEDFYLSSESIKNNKIGAYLKDNNNIERLRNIFPTINRTNSTLFSLLWPTWQKSRNELFHSDPIKPPIIDFKDAEKIIYNILEIMRDLLSVYIIQFDENKKLNQADTFSAIGIDESGKGDIFGPLVTVAAYVPGDKDFITFLINSGIKDSKKINDKKILELFDLIKTKKEIYWVNVTVKPKKYNELYSKIRNLNKLLAWEHARSLENLLTELSKQNINCETVIADQFEDNGLVEKSLMNLGKRIHLIKIPKAESNISVAVASVIARAQFLYEIKALGENIDCVLPKGAGQNVIEFIKQLKQESKLSDHDLDNYIKMNFKNVKEIIDK